MRLGGYVIGNWDDPEGWAKLARSYGYTAVNLPLDYRAEVREIDAYVAAAKAHDLLIAEVGIWNNLLDPDRATREANRATALRQLELADYVGARCCVNVSGSRGTPWDGPHAKNLTDETFEAIVAVTRELIDRVRPTRTVYTLEPMPWMYPVDPESYAALLEAVDREAFAVHLDPVNTIADIPSYYANADRLRAWFDRLGPKIVSCHAKDIRLGSKLTVHLDECRPGTGALDYRAYLECLATLDEDTPLMLEHMTEAEDYRRAMRYLHEVASDAGIPLYGGPLPVADG